MSGFQFFEFLNFKSGHVRISNPDTSGFQFFNCKISNPDVSGILFRTCPDFNYGLQILSSPMRPNKKLEIQKWSTEKLGTPIKCSRSNLLSSFRDVLPYLNPSQPKQEPLLPHPYSIHHIEITMTLLMAAHNLPNPTSCICNY